MQTKKIRYICAGSLITPLYVLTVAHVLTRELVGVRLGVHSLQKMINCDLSSEKNCRSKVQDFDIALIHRHIFYSFAKKINNIGLIKLNRAADLTKSNVNTICLPLTPQDQIGSLQMNEPETIQQMSIIGWGTLENGDRSDVLMKTQVPYVDNFACKKRFNDEYGDQLNIFPTFLCAGGIVNNSRKDAVRN